MLSANLVGIAVLFGLIVGMLTQCDYVQLMPNKIKAEIVAFILLLSVSFYVLWVG